MRLLIGMNMNILYTRIMYLYIQSLTKASIAFAMKAFVNLVSRFLKESAVWVTFTTT